MSFFHDVPRALAEDALRRERAHPSASVMAAVWPAPAWPAVSTRVLICTDDRCFPVGFMRRVAEERLGIVPDEIRESPGQDKTQRPMLRRCLHVYRALS